jgi:hypothetical protein
MQIPIRFQGEQYESQTSRQPQWLQSQQQQTPQESVWKQGQQQLPQQGQQESVWKQGQQQIPQQGFQQFGTQQYGQQGYQQQQQPYQQQMFQQGQGQVQFVEKTIRDNNVAVTDLTTLHLILRQAGACYVKEHVLLKLCQDNLGMIRKWHNEITIKNLDTFSMIAHKWGLTLPFPESLEKREHEIKQQLGNVSSVISPGEAYTDLCFSAHLLQQELTCAFMSGINQEFKEACKTACAVLCENYVQLKQAIKNTDQYFPPPIVKQVVVHEGVQSRR